VATGDNNFAPVNLVISVGDAVRWRNVGAVVHTTTSGTRPIASGLWNEVLDVGASYTRAFDTPGTFTYVCLIHVGKKSKVTVNP
jgi:plastocyanin